MHNNSLCELHLSSLRHTLMFSRHSVQAGGVQSAQHIAHSVKSSVKQRGHAVVLPASSPVIHASGSPSQSTRSALASTQHSGIQCLTKNERPLLSTRKPCQSLPPVCKDAHAAMPFNITSTCTLLTNNSACPDTDLCCGSVLDFGQSQALVCLLQARHTVDPSFRPKYGPHMYQ